MSSGSTCTCGDCWVDSSGGFDICVRTGRIAADDSAAVHCDHGQAVNTDTGEVLQEGLTVAEGHWIAGQTELGRLDYDHFRSGDSNPSARGLHEPRLKLKTRAALEADLRHSEPASAPKDADGYIPANASQLARVSLNALEINLDPPQFQQFVAHLQRALLCFKVEPDPPELPAIVAFVLLFQLQGPVLCGYKSDINGQAPAIKGQSFIDRKTVTGLALYREAFAFIQTNISQIFQVELWDV